MEAVEEEEEEEEEGERVEVDPLKTSFNLRMQTLRIRS